MEKKENIILIVKKINTKKNFKMKTRNFSMYNVLIVETALLTNFHVKTILCNRALTSCDSCYWNNFQQSRVQQINGFGTYYIGFIEDYPVSGIRTFYYNSL